jgi:hypothetical protein
MWEMLFAHKDILLKLEQLEQKINEQDGEILQIFSYLKAAPASLQKRYSVGINRSSQGKIQERYTPYPIPTFPKKPTFGKKSQYAMASPLGLLSK